MKKIGTCFLFMFVCWSAWAAEREVNTTVQEVTVYHSGGLVKRSAALNLAPGVHELSFTGLTSKMVLNSLKFTNREVTVLNKRIVKKLSNEAFQALLDRKSSLEAQLTLLEAKFKDPAFVTKVDDLEKMMALYSQEVMAIKKTIRQTDQQIDEAQQLLEIDLPHEAAAILKVTISVASPLTDGLRMQYVTGGVGWSPHYEITAASSNQQGIELKYLAKVMSQTGEDWDNVTLRFSSAFPLEPPAKLPRPNEPWVLGMDTYDNQGTIQSEHPELNQIANLEGVEYEEVYIPASVKVRTLPDRHSLKSNGTVFSFPILDAQLPARFYFYGFPSIDPEPYLVSEIRGWDTLGLIDGVASITYNNTDIGKSVVEFTQANKVLTLPISRENTVYLQRREIADKKYFKTSITNKKVTMTLAYAFEIRNNNSFPVSFEVADQLPISQSKYASVEIEEQSGGTYNEELGEVTWIVDLKPGESVTKKLIYTVETEGRFGSGMRFPSRKSKYYRVSRPKF